MNLKNITIVLFVLFSNTSICQEIVFETASLKEKPNNIFQSAYSGYNGQQNFNKNNGLKVSDLKDYLIIDYTKKHYIYSFIYDKEMKLISERTKKLENTSYPNFFESYGPLDNRIFVFQGFDKDKLYLVQENKDYSGTLFDIGKNEYVGSFVSLNVFYHLGYDKKNKELVFNFMDSDLNQKTKRIAFDEVFHNLNEIEKNVMNKIFSSARFEEISTVQLNSVDEFTRKNKFYIKENQLVFSINPKQLDKEIYKTYILKIDLSNFFCKTQSFDVSVPKNIAEQKIRFSSYSRSQNFFSLIKKTKAQINSYLFDKKLFVILGNTKGFLVTIFDTKTEEQVYLNLVDNNSFLDTYTNDLVDFDFDFDETFLNKKNKNKSLEKRLKTIFDLRSGIKVNDYKENYHITVGGFGSSSGGGVMKNTSLASTSGGTFPIGKSINFVLNKNNFQTQKTEEIHFFEQIERFRKKSFFTEGKLKKITKKTPRTEVQFKYGESYFLAYYSNYEDKYIIRKFN